MTQSTHTPRKAPDGSKAVDWSKYHTPTPWNVNGGMRQGIKTVYAATGSIAEMTDCKAHSDAEQEANAAFIVRCVNSHEALIDALNALEIWATFQAAENRQKREMMGQRQSLAADHPIYEARKALAAAKGDA